MGRYRKKPVEIDAIQFVDLSTVIDWIEQLRAEVSWTVSPLAITIPTLEGDMTASRGDWIIRGVKGEFYPCKPDIFEATYDFVGVSQPHVSGTRPVEFL